MVELLEPSVRWRGEAFMRFVRELSAVARSGEFLRPVFYPFQIRRLSDLATLGADGVRSEAIPEEGDQYFPVLLCFWSPDLNISQQETKLRLDF